MRVLIAPDSFKDCLTAPQVIHAISRGLLKVQPETQIIGKPVSDGGEGLLQTLIDNLEGRYVESVVNDPLMRPLSAKLGILDQQATAVIEMAQASGIELLSQSERNPMLTTSYGTGQLISKALDEGFRKLIIGIGGSATNDGGVGMAQALGVKLLDASAQPIAAGGAGLAQLQTIDIETLDPRISDCQIQVACDVKNPLTGDSGASAVYGPQKGATEQMVETLDQNLTHLASLILEFLDKDISDIPGAGAAGGLGAGLVAFLDAELVPGFDIVASMLDLENEVANADLVITAEGKIDQQTKFGKAPYGVAMIAKKHRKPVYAFAGQIGGAKEELIQLGFTDVISISDSTITVEESIRRAPELLETSAAKVFQNFLNPG